MDPVIVAVLAVLGIGAAWLAVQHSLVRRRRSRPPSSERWADRMPPDERERP